MANKISPRDFIYMDVERIRSFYAQIEEGLVESSSRESGSEQKINGKVGGKLPLIANAEAAGSALWNKKETETRTLHDHMFNYVEKSLLKSKLLMDFNKEYSPDSWSREKYLKTTNVCSIIKIQGSVSINSFKQVVSLVKNMHDIGKIISSFASLEKENFSKHAKQQIQQEALKAMNLPDKKFTENLARLIELFYGQAIIFKLSPLKEIGDCVFSCRLNEDYLRDPIEDIQYKFGTTPTDHWTLVGQIAKITQREEVKQEQPLVDDDILEKAISDLFIGSKEMINVGTVQYPYISLTPLAIYRGA